MTLQDIVNAPLVRCDEVQWSLFGVSMALLLGGTAFSIAGGPVGAQVAQNAPQALAPRAGVALHIAPGQTVRMAVSKGLRTPDVVDQQARFTYALRTSTPGPDGSPNQRLFYQSASSAGGLRNEQAVSTEIGYLFNDQIEAMLESPLTVSISLLVGGIVLLYVDKWFPQSVQNGESDILAYHLTRQEVVEAEERLSFKKSFIIVIKDFFVLYPS